MMLLHFLINVGVALGSTRTDVAMEAADITITQDDPLLVPAIIGLSKNSTNNKRKFCYGNRT